MNQLLVLSDSVWSCSFPLYRSCSGSHDVSKWFSASNLCASWICVTGVLSKPFPHQYQIVIFYKLSRLDFCFSELTFVYFLLDHRRERSEEGSGFTSATRFPPRGAFSSPPSSTSSPCAPACLHTASRHDPPSTSPLHKHGRRRGRLELPVHLPVPPSSYLLRAGSASWVTFFMFSASKYYKIYFHASTKLIVVLSVSTDSHSQHGRPSFVHRDDRTNKTHERLQKKLKDRQGGGGGGQVKDSPPPSPQKSCNSPPVVDIHNGIGGKGLEADHRHMVACSDKQMGKGKNGESRGKYIK